GYRCRCRGGTNCRSTCGARPHHTHTAPRNQARSCSCLRRTESIHCRTKSSGTCMTGRVLVARLDSMGDVLLAGPGGRAIATHAESVTLLVGPRGRTAAELLPGTDEVLEFCAPWIDPEPPELTAESVDALAKQIRDARFDAALILTSFHQSPLPLALVLRMA